VYYTPQYVVDYIVQNTVGKLIDGKTSKEVSKIKIIDPACGSGSFLIGAYQYLLDWHKHLYNENLQKQKSGAIGRKNDVVRPDGNLTTAEKKRILLNNIYGVDIDVNAVEVSKLSLLLKCMEGETEASIASQLRLFNERVLPTLDENIKCGNSLVDIDFYSGELDFGEDKRIKPFNWQRAFPEVFKIKKPELQNDIKQHNKRVLLQAEEAKEKAMELIKKYGGNVEDPLTQYGEQGGFDVVIGNPPYIMLQNLETREVFEYALKKFRSAKYKIDTYQLFIEQAVKLLKNGGFLGFITPNSFLKNIHAEPIRKFIIDTTSIKEVLLFNYAVFAAASVDTCIIILEKGEASNNNEVEVNTSEAPFTVKNISNVRQSTFVNNNRTAFNLLISDIDSKLLNKISKHSNPLGYYCGAYFGIQTFDKKKYVSETKKDIHYEPVIDGGNIEPYNLKPPTEYVHFHPSAIKSGGSESIYRQDRICIRQIGATPVATIVPANIFTLNTVYNVFLKEKSPSDLNFLLGIITSNVTKFFWNKNNSDEKKTFPKIKKEAILSIPVPIINEGNIKLHDEIITLVNWLLQLNNDKTQTKLATNLEQLQNKIDYCESRINQVVYQLYRLTEEEVVIIESK